MADWVRMFERNSNCDEVVESWSKWPKKAQTRFNDEYRFSVLLAINKGKSCDGKENLCQMSTVCDRDSKTCREYNCGKADTLCAPTRP